MEPDVSRERRLGGELDAGPDKEGGGTRADWLGMSRAPYPSRAARTVRLDTKCYSTRNSDRLCSLIAARERDRGEGKEGSRCGRFCAPRCATVATV